MSTSVPSTHRRGVGLLTVAGVAWGTGGLTGALLARVAGLQPLAVAGYRLALGGLLVAVAVAAAGGRLPRGSAAWRRIAAVAGLAALFQAVYFAAVAVTSVGLATLVTIGTAPVVVTVAEVARGRAGRGAAGTALVALLGLALLVGLPGAGGAQPLTGVGLATLSGSAFAVMTLLAARPVAGLDAGPTTAAAFVLGGLLLAPLAGADLAFDPTPEALALLAVLALVPTALAYTAFFAGLRHAAGPGVGTVMALLEPLTAAVLAALLLGERLGAAQLVGAVLLGVAVLRAARA